ncbi:MAG: hypothetical protein R3Y64_11055, partial [Peptostreptococcaceae bacterium]
MFKLNPIKVLNNKDRVKIVETSSIFEVDFDKIHLKTLSNVLIKEFEVDDETLLDIDINLGDIKIIYFFENEEIGEEIVKITETLEVEEITSKDTLFIKLMSEIQDKMDNPKGTDEEISNHTLLLKEATINEKAKSYISTKITNYLSEYDDLTDAQVKDFSYRIFANVYGMGVLQELDDDPTVGEIMVNARTFPKFNCEIYYIQNQVKKKYDKTFNTLVELENVFRKVVEFSKKELNSTDNAMIEATRPNKDRVNIIIPDASENWVLNIRKFSNFVPNMDMMKHFGTIDEFNDKLFNILVKGLCNIGIGGYMGTGKTTMINYLLTYTEPISRKVVVSSISETD